MVGDSPEQFGVGGGGAIYDRSIQAVRSLVGVSVAL